MDKHTRTNARRLLTLAMALLVAGSLPAWAQHDTLPGDGPAVPPAMMDDEAGFGPGHGPGLDRLARRLGLTETQREAVAKIHEAGRARDLPLRKQLRQLRHELQGEMMKDNPSEKAVLALATKLGDLRTQLQAGRLRDRLAVRAQLTDEQRDRFLMMGGPGGPAGPDGRGRHGGHAGGRRGPGAGRGDCDGQGPRAPRGPGGGPRWQQQDAD